MTRGPTPKSATRRQRRNRQPRLEVHSGVPDIQPPQLPAIRPKMPPYPKSILKVTKERWATYWQSEIAIVATAVDLPVVERLHRRYDERERAFREVRSPVGWRSGRRGRRFSTPCSSTSTSASRRSGSLRTG